MFKFIDLFAGIGGIRISFERSGGKCVFSSEIDKYSQKTYKAFFGEVPDFSDILQVNPPGDITQIPATLVPDHDILTGGFPCQPFSLAGVSKKNSLGRPHGFSDPTQGTLFFNIKEIIAEKQPKAFFLENVKNLKSHDNGKTFKIITDVLEQLNYDIFYRVIDARGWVPQHRERIYIIGFRRPDFLQQWYIHDFDEFFRLEPPQDGPSLSDILEEQVSSRYTVPTGTWNSLQRHKEKHRQKGNGFGFSLIEPPLEGKITRTLSARYHKDGAEILIQQDNPIPRRLTPLECSRLMGYPKEYQQFFSRETEVLQPVSDNQAYKQFGNSVVVPLVADIAKLIVKKLEDLGAI